MARTLRTEVVGQWKEETLSRVPQDSSKFPTFKVAPQDVLEVVYKKLAGGNYKHMCP